MRLHASMKWFMGTLACVSGIGCGEAPSSDTREEPTAKVAERSTAVATERAADSNAERTAAERRCALLDDPQIRAQMSGAFEMKLLRECGVGLVPPTEELMEKRPRAKTRVEEPELLAVGGDLLVNDPASDTFSSTTTQSETSIVVVGNVVCVAYNDSGGNNGFSGFSASLDGGVTFTDRGSFPDGDNNDTSGGDPSLAYSVRDDAFYYASLSSAGLSLWRSTDDCQNFQYVGPIVHQEGGHDKELIAIDNTPASPHFGRIYAGWTDFYYPTDRNMTAYSDDGGATWTAQRQLQGSGGFGQGMWPAVAPNGDVYMALVNRGMEPGSTQDQWIYKSTDGGASFVQMTDIATDQLRPEEDDDTSRCGRQALNGDIRNLSSPQIVTTPDTGAPAGYVIHAVYPYDSDGAGPDDSNVFYKRSVDGGASWSAETLLNDDGTATDQWFPALGADPNGTVVVSFYDRRLDPANNLAFDRFATYSSNAGLTWSPNERVSDVTSPVAQINPNFDPSILPCYHGDYDQLVVSGDTAHMVWSDDRRVTTTGPNPDVYYDLLLTNPSRGLLRADSAVLSCSDEVSFTLFDLDLAGAGTQSISLSTSNGDQETLVLVETAGRPGNFKASIATAPTTPVSNDGTLELTHGAVVTGTYEDADDGSGNPAVSTAEVEADCAGPAISGARTAALRGVSATVAVDASEPATLEVEYGFDCGALTKNASSAGELSESPSALLEPLSPARTYFYTVTATDALGNETHDDNAGSCYSFTTLTRVYLEDFEGGLDGFTIDNGAGAGNGLWHLSSACASTATLHSRPNTLYYGQDATCNFNNGLRNEGTATSPSLHLTDTSFAVIELNYYLGTEFLTAYDRATVEVSVDGGPFTVVEDNYTNDGNALISNSRRWLHVVVDLRSVLAGLPSATLQVRFHFDTVDNTLNHLAGFYVDDVELWAVPPPEPCAADADCNDGSFCSGTEQCVAGFCRNGPPVVCADDDGIACTDEVCDETALGCVSRPNDERCDDGLLCNGQETCDPALDCQAASEPFQCPPDAVDCTVELCDEERKTCEPSPDFAFCDDGLFCNGYEQCDLQTGCYSPGGLCDDGIDCSIDLCNEEADQCNHVPDHAFCSDGLFCTGTETCGLTFPTYGCTSPGNPCSDPEICDEAGQQCVDCQNETERPKFSFVPGDITTTLCGSFDIGTATAADFCGVTVSDNRPASFPPGTTVVTWSATDPAGNVTTATQRVTVILTDNAACCPSGTNVIVGTSNDDTLIGGPGADCILARGAQDTVNGNGGNDFISGGDGNDILNGGSGLDHVFGGSGQDTMNGGNDADTLFGAGGDDICNGGPGNDTLNGGEGQDQLRGDDGNDALFGDEGDDSLTGGIGNDNLVGGANNDNCNGGTGTNTFAQCEFGAPNSCANGVRNGTETDVDCGGGCPDCASGRRCISGSDCQSGLFCVMGRCEGP